MRILLFASFVLSLCFFVSCQKEVSVELPTRTQDDKNDSIYLKQLVYLDTTVTPGVDTALRFDFSYDSQKRLIGISSKEYFASLPGPELWAEYELFYQGADTLPYKVITNSGSFTPGDTPSSDTSFLTYQNGWVERDSILYSGQVFTKNQVFAFTKLSDTRWKMLFKGNGVIVDSTFITLSRVNGNIVSEKDSTYAGSLKRVGAYTISYDTKTNPYYRFTIPYPTLTLSNWLFGEKFPNNQLSYSSTSSLPGPPYNSRYEYQYNSNNLPVFAWEKDPNMDGTKVIFIYTDL